MTKTGTILVSILAASTLHAVPAAAKTINADCNEGMTVSNAISKLDPTEGNNIRVSGVCDEFIAIMGFAQLSPCFSLQCSWSAGAGSIPFTLAPKDRDQ